MEVQELDNKIKELQEQRKIYLEAKKKSSEENAKMKSMEYALVDILEGMDRTSYKSPHGTFSFYYKESFGVPRDTENREMFFEFLREKGVFNTLITVDSRTLNKWAKEEAKVAEENGVLDFEIPGLKKSEPVAVPSLRKE